MFVHHQLIMLLGAISGSQKGLTPRSGVKGLKSDIYQRTKDTTSLVSDFPQIREIGQNTVRLAMLSAGRACVLRESSKAAEMRYQP